MDPQGEAYTVGASVRWLLDSPDAAALHAMLDQAVLSWHPRFESLPALMKGAERPLHGAAGEAARAAAVSRLIEGRYPDIERIIPSSYATRTVLETQDLAKAVKLASYFATASSVTSASRIGSYSGLRAKMPMLALSPLSPERP